MKMIKDFAAYCNHSKLNLWAIVIFCLSVVVQLILVYWYNGGQTSDFASYLDYAKGVADSGTLYPSTEHIYSKYIWAPGLINYFALLLYIFKTTKAILFFNVLLNVILAAEIFYLAKKYFSPLAANIFLLAVAIYPTTYGINLFTGSELPFMVLCYGAVIAMLQDKYRYFILAGILISLSNWIRPFFPAMILVSIYICWMIVAKGRRLKSFGLMLVSAALLSAAIGAVTYLRMGYFNYQSTTSGVNLMMGANDDADGSYSNAVFEEGKIGYIENADSVTFAEKDAFWKKQSIDWIMHNPVEWGMLIPKKTVNLFLSDMHFLWPLIGDMDDVGNSGDYIKGMVKSFPRWDFGQWLVLFNQIFYGCVLLLSLWSLVSLIKSRNKVAISLMIFVILMVGMTVVTVCSGRYHAPFIPVLILFASYKLSEIIANRRNDKIHCSNN